MNTNTEMMLQVGYDCGVKYIDEAYSQIMSHYDLFFIIDTYEKGYKGFLDDLTNKGLIVDNQMVEMTIEDAAKKIGYTLKEYDYCEPSDETVNSLDDFDFDFDVK